MSLALYVDEHVARAVALGLRLRGVDVLTVQEDDRSGAPDPELLDRATELGRPIFTQDDDLLAEAKRRQLSGRSFAGVVFAQQLAVTIGGCVRDLEIVAKVCSVEELESAVLFLPL